MKVSNQFRLPLPVPKAWEVLNDIPRVAQSAPGAQLVEARADGSYIGTLRVKLGPVALTFRGTLVYKERDEASHRVIAEASGNEERARGTARARVVFMLFEEAGGTRVDVETDVLLAGPIAQYARGAALIQATAQVLMDDFARNFAAEFSTLSEIPDPADDEVKNSKAEPEAAGSVSVISLVFRGLIEMVKSWFTKQGSSGAER